MNLHRTYALLVLFGFVGVTTAWAFQPGPDTIRECPKCKVSIAQATMMSGNTFGARFWTDGKMIAPMLPDRPWLVKCPKCATLFWLDEAKKLGEQQSWDKNKKWPNAADPILPTESDYLGMLSAGKLDAKKTLYARRCAWWAANDAARTNETVTVVFSPAQTTNVIAMASLLDETNPDERIMKAEIMRELKRFDTCIKLLAKPFDEENHTSVAAFITTLAKKKIAQVREIKEPESPKKANGQD